MSVHQCGIIYRIYSPLHVTVPSDAEVDSSGLGVVLRVGAWVLVWGLGDTVAVVGQAVALDADFCVGWYGVVIIYHHSGYCFAGNAQS